MAISEAKMKIVIDNYFKNECNVDTSIRQAFEKGFRIGVKKGMDAERKNGKWIEDECSICGCYVWHGDVRNFCPNCGADMRE